MAGYRDLEVYKIAYELSLEIHKMSLSLPQFERYEEGSQIRRSSKSVCANIVEGFALRKYKNEYLHYLYRSYGSCEETRYHLEVLFGTHSLNDRPWYEERWKCYTNLSRKLFSFIQSVERNHQPPKYLNRES
jgi:four helix bundle protein